jgi:GNAT superfamily N-acetyltransferase
VAHELIFRPYSSQDRKACLALFDANCPAYFASNERADYEEFLATVPKSYELCLIDDEVAGAFGLIGTDTARRRLSWIMLDPRSQGRGVGRAIMNYVAAIAVADGIPVVDIAASHISAPFFARFGAITVNVTDNGWGPGMHRVDMELRVGHGISSNGVRGQV